MVLRLGGLGLTWLRSRVSGLNREFRGSGFGAFDQIEVKSVFLVAAFVGADDFPEPLRNFDETHQAQNASE